MVLQKQIFMFTLICLSTCFISISAADDRAQDRATLGGIQTIIVKVRSWEPEWRAELKKAGLEESYLQSLIEQKLEKAGIPVLQEEAAQNSETEGVLNIRMTFLDPEPGKKTTITLDDNSIERIDTKKKYVYAIRLNLRQMAMIARNPATKSVAITWQAESLGFRRLALIREDVMDVIDAFIEAYLSENPQPQKG